MLKKKLKKIIFYTVLALFFAILLYKFLFYIDLKVEQKEINSNFKIERLNKEAIDKLEDGDIILRKGFGYMSHMVSQKFNDGTFDISHCAILKKDGDQWVVIQSLSSDVSDFNGVQLQTLSEFLKQSKPNSLVVVRPKAFKNDRILLSDHALKLVDDRIPFDRYGNYEDTSELYCSELIWYILFDKLNLFEPPQTKEEIKDVYFNMSSFTDKERFDIVINKQKELD